MRSIFVNEDERSFRSWYANNPKVSTSIENAIQKLLPRGKGIEISCGNNLSCESNSSIEDLQLDFVVVPSSHGPIHELRRVFKEAYRILKINGVLVVSFFDWDSKAAEGLCGKERESHNACTAEEILFELSHCGFKYFEFVQTLFEPVQNITEVQEPKSGHGEGLFVVVQARKRI